MNRMDEFRQQLQNRMAALRTGSSAAFVHTPGHEAEGAKSRGEVERYLTPAPEEVWQWWEAVRGSMHVRMNEQYYSYAAATDFMYVHDDDTINAFAGRNDNKEKPFRIVFFGGAMRFSRLRIPWRGSVWRISSGRTPPRLRALASIS